MGLKVYHDSICVMQVVPFSSHAWYVISECSHEAQEIGLQPRMTCRYLQYSCFMQLRFAGKLSLATFCALLLMSASETWDCFSSIRGEWKRKYSLIT
ncbi:unnamed protein product [Prunus armeniaca]|uniref:Uncharacterized protein n=1 Tax=Prunus armeniaca TaxID=36596 RepID=A0A6J5VTU1_PRUAR|nr:unnamed protein product [Prunus armeniaca]CAB4292719.1 unnamed protein product [Prunus armeniaca]